MTSTTCLIILGSLLAYSLFGAGLMTYVAKKTLSFLSTTTILVLTIPVEFLSGIMALFLLFNPDLNFKNMPPSIAIPCAILFLILTPFCFAFGIMSNKAIENRIHVAGSEWLAPTFALLCFVCSLALFGRGFRLL